ncbi:52 kDa repressor of the inhibitor of the protein kinase-like [Liolophura sinensis]|uniref:52 kDa repressor of the inhibitor of the protein kinase-like n=1 Tax=Liolophura sinensis TaxID=3198878 RepID=UPI00315892EB
MPVICAAYGCNSQLVKGGGISFFAFPKDATTRKVWLHYCKRDFDLKYHHKLCSKHFSKCMFDRDPEKLASLGYENAVARLTTGAVPDIPLSIEISSPLSEVPKQQQQQSVRPVSTPHRKAFTKRNRKRALDELLEEFEKDKENADPETSGENSHLPSEAESFQVMTEKVVIEAPVTRSVATQIGKAPLKTISKR